MADLSFDYTFTLTWEDDALEGGGHLDLEIELEEDEELEIFELYNIALEAVLEELYGDENIDFESMPNINISIEDIALEE